MCPRTSGFGNQKGIQFIFAVRGLGFALRKTVYIRGLWVRGLGFAILKTKNTDSQNHGPDVRGLGFGLIRGLKVRGLGFALLKTKNMDSQNHGLEVRGLGFGLCENLKRGPRTIALEVREVREVRVIDLAVRAYFYFLSQKHVFGPKILQTSMVNIRL